MSYQLLNLISLVIVNCLGAGLIMLPPRLSEFGISAFGSWLLAGIGVFSLSMVFTKLAEGNSEYYLHDLIAINFHKSWQEVIKNVFFWQYLLFVVLSNAFLTCTLIVALGQIFPDFVVKYSLCIHAGLFTLFYFIHRFGVRVSQRLIDLFTLIKILILIAFPLFVVIFFKPKAIILSNTDGVQSVIKGLFLTVFPMIGVESIGMEVKTSKRILKYGMIIGVAICLLASMLNTYVMMRYVPNLVNSTSAYSDLFNILFGVQNKWIINGSLVLVMLGSLHGWTHTALSTAKTGTDLLPKFMRQTNKYGTNEFMLGFASITPFCFILISELFVKSHTIVDIVVDTATFMYILFSLAAIVSFFMKPIHKLSDYFYGALSILYLLFASVGLGFLPIVFGFLSLSVLLSIFFKKIKKF